MPNWAPSHLATEYDKFSAIFKHLISDCAIDTDMKWKKWYGIQDCENSFPAGPTEFQKVIITKMFREDRLESSLVNFIEKILGTLQVLGPKLQFEEIYTIESAPGTPILFITSPGSDPSNQLEEFAIKKIGRENFVQMSLGGNQNEAAMKMLKEAAESGKWIFLKNLHLVPSFLVLLEKEFAGLSKHKNFRLWLTTEFQDRFPAILLETCYKLSYESPPGVKKNIERAYSLVDPSFISTSAMNSQLVFVLSYFHSVIQERRNFIPQGWSKYYEFSYADFVAAIKLFDSLAAAKMTPGVLKT
jgi:dynein heavy chain 2, cytosolic